MRDALDVVAFVVGAALVVVTLLSAVRATILPRGGAEPGQPGW